MKRWILIGTILVGTLVSVFGLNGTVVTDVTPTAALVSIQGPGSAQVEELSSRTTTQGIVSDSWSLSDALALSGTGWMLLDSLPSNNPTQVPDGRLDLSSRLLQLEAKWQIIPGALVLDMGKQIIHPSSGFFKTPLNLLTRGAAGNTPQQTPAASPQWEEGWWGVKIIGLLGDWTLEDFVAPPLTWPDSTDAILQYVSLQQSDLSNQVRLDWHWGVADIQVLNLLTVNDLGTSSSSMHDQTGLGFDTNVGDHLTVRAEATMADSLSRLAVLNATAQTSASQSLSWVPKALVGATWSINNDVSFVGEYYYDGLGFTGNDYTSALQYATNRLNSGSLSPDVAGQFGNFSLAENYVFFRLMDSFTDQISGQAWTEINLQDISGMYGLGLATTYDHWGLSGSLTETWGADGTEGEVLPFLWQVDLEVQFYF
jgi:hypothetical protein